MPCPEGFRIVEAPRVTIGVFTRLMVPKPVRVILYSYASSHLLAANSIIDM
jgi:hypothetical protein